MRSLRALLAFLSLNGLIPYCGLKNSLLGLSSHGQKACWGEAQKPHSAEAVCQRGALAGMSGVAVGAVPAEASCPPRGGCAGVPGGNSPAKKRVFLRMTELSGGAPTLKCLGARTFTLEAAYPSKGVTCATASAWVISASPLSKSSRRYFQLPMPSSCIYES